MKKEHKRDTASNTTTHINSKQEIHKNNKEAQNKQAQ